MTEHKRPEHINFYVSNKEGVQNIKIGNNEFTIHTLESLKDGQILIENDISDGNGVIIEV